MNYQTTYLRLWRRYFQFSGRATRTEYWKPFLLNLILYAVLIILTYTVSPAFKLVYDLYALAIFIPLIALLFRRLHDTGRSGWWWLIALIPLLGSLWLIWLLAQPSNPGANRYGQPSLPDGPGAL